MRETVTVEPMTGLDRILAPDQIGQVVVSRDAEWTWQVRRAWVRPELSPDDVQSFGHWALDVLDELDETDDPIACGWTPSANFHDRWYLNARLVD